MEQGPEGYHDAVSRSAHGMRQGEIDNEVTVVCRDVRLFPSTLSISLLRRLTIMACDSGAKVRSQWMPLRPFREVSDRVSNAINPDKVTFRGDVSSQNRAVSNDRLRNGEHPALPWWIGQGAGVSKRREGSLLSRRRSSESH